LDREPSYEIEEPGGPVLTALRELPASQRAAVVLTYYAGYPASEVGKALGCSAATARVHASRGRKRLRKTLERQDD
jgi:RNA polymerase sigma factor (sigma-70 family)